MNLYLISQDHNCTWDTYDSAVVAAKDETRARLIHPIGNGTLLDPLQTTERVLGDTWVRNPSLVTVTHIGTAAEGTAEGVICASFNAG